MLIIKLKGIIISVIIIININFAQTNNDLDSVKIDTSKQNTTNKINPIKIDTIKHKNKKEIVEKQSLRLHELKILYNNLFNKSPFYIPDNNIIYSDPYTSTNYGYQTKNYRTNDGLKLFNVYLHKLLAKDYGMRRMYDLGELGRYLGVAKKVATIILWLLSF